ncbi:MAG: hypothetical protein ABSD27_04635 [Bryobacteraceae bacterium]
MRIQRVCSMMLLAVFAAAALLAADVNGRWVAQVPGRDGQPMEITFNFKADGAQLTGSVTTHRGETQISEGKINGDEISFTQVIQFGDRRMKQFYKGKVAGDEIRFTRQREGGDQMREFTAKRVS